MQIVLLDHGREHELDVVIHEPEATVGHLVAVLSAAADPPLDLEADGTIVPAGRRLDRAGIRAGCRVRLVPSGPPPVERDHGAGPDRHAAPSGPVGRTDPSGRVGPTDPSGSVGPVEPARSAGSREATAPGPAWEVAVVGGLDAGHFRAVGPGRHSLGRRADLLIDHDTVSSHHATVSLGDVATVVDEGSLNGTWVDGRPATTPTVVAAGGVARLGAVHVTLRRVVHDRPAAQPPAGRGTATNPFNRPPRPAPPAPLDAIEAPEPLRRSSEARSALGVTAIVAPLVMGGAMVAITGQVQYAFVLLLSPLMAIGTAIDSRRRGRRTRRRDEARLRRDVETFRSRLVERATEERERLIREVPDPAEILRRVEAPSTRLWERRPGHPDWLRLRVGVGAVPWTPPVTDRHDSEEVRAVLAEADRIVEAPIVVDLAGGGVVGVVGPRPGALAVARALVVQAAVLHGPADLPMLLLTDGPRAADWDWAKWLPHVVDAGGSGRRTIVTDADAAEAACRALVEARASAEDLALDRGATGPTRLVVVDDDELTGGRRSPIRAVLRGAAGPVAGVVVAASEDRLPAACTTVVELIDGDGTAVVHHLRTGIRVDSGLACGVSGTTALRAARGLARFDDPELGDTGTRLPAIVGLLPLLGLDRPTAAAISARWSATGRDPDLAGPIGVSADGVVTVDLGRDGPHGLVAGTTGAGKSEFLRTLVAGLAAGSSPEHLTFVLIDFKGGSAFDRCAELPHTVGYVTDLDPHLAERALRCLDAELHHRERVLRDAGAADLVAYRRLTVPTRPALPRLVVVVDEFATLRAELPDFVDALVGVAQRGRSLGVHLVLATQRPSGAVSENIRANTNLRIALRVQDGGDSKDVIDRPDAARIGRDQPGRALARFGPGEVVAVQTALSGGVPCGGHGPVEVRPFTVAGTTGPAVSRASAGDGPSDLALLVDACTGAHRASGRPDPRRPWPDPLPLSVPLESLATPRDAGRRDVPSAADVTGLVHDAGRDARPREAGAQVVGSRDAEVRFALADLPDEQTQRPVGWLPRDGNLLLAGLPGSGTTSALMSVAVAATGAASPSDLHLYAIDFGTGDLEPLAALPHTGAVVRAPDRERQARLVTMLRAEVERRRAADVGNAPRILVLVDGVGPFRSEWDDVAGPVAEAFDTVFRDGPAVGVHTVVTGDRVMALPSTLRSLVRQQFLFRLGDDLDYGQAGFRSSDLPMFVPGRAIDVERRLEVQVARPGSGFPAAIDRIAARWAGATTASTSSPRPPAASSRRPAPIGVLPTRVTVSEVADHIRVDTVPRHLPIGVGERGLAPLLADRDGPSGVAGLLLHPGDHALVAGPARSGRTTALAVIEAVAGSAGWATVTVAGPRSPLGRRGDALAPGEVESSLAASLDALDGPVLLLVDDAEFVDPDNTVMPAILARPEVTVVAAGRADVLRGLYAHWTRTVRQSRVGLLLQPDVDLDGDLLSLRLPRRATTPIGAGRGYLCLAGEHDLVQVAQPDDPLDLARTA